MPLQEADFERDLVREFGLSRARMGCPGVRGVLFSPHRSARALSGWWRKPSKRRDAPSSLARHYDQKVSSPLVLVMAAGEGTRMRSSLPKMLHPVCGRAMVAWPILAAREAGAGKVAAIVSPGRDISAGFPGEVETVVQPEPDGTGGAVRAALPLIEEAESVLVLSGDHPVISAEVIAGFLAAHASSGAAATVMTIELDDPGSYGRVVRAGDGSVERVVEAKADGDATAEELAIREINAGTYVFDAAAAGRRARRPLQRQRPGRVLPARRLPGPARGGPLGRRPPCRRPRGDDGRQQSRRAGRGRGRGAAPHPRAPHARRRHRRRPRLRPGSTPMSRSPPTPGSSPPPACAAPAPSAPARSSAR